MATTIANLTAKADGSMEGVFATLRVNAPIAVLPNAHKTREDAPDFRCSRSVSRRSRFVGRPAPRSRVAWAKRLRSSRGGGGGVMSL